MYKLEVGKVMPELKGTPEGVRFAMTDSGGELLICFKRPTLNEIEQIREGKAQFGIFVPEGVIFILSKFGDLEWMDAPFHVALTRGLTTLREVGPGKGYGCTIILADTVSGEVKALRYVSFNTEFSRRLKSNIEQQKSDVFRKNEYDTKLHSIMRRYSTKDMVKYAEARCTISGDRHGVLDEVFTLAEAAELWGVHSSTLRKAVASGRFEEGADFRKAGGTYVVTKVAMIREYGEPPKKE